MNSSTPARLIACLLPFALAACATQATSTEHDAAAADAAEPTGDAVAPAPAAGNGLLPPVPQPPERPVAPESVTNPDLPLQQRVDAFVDYTATTYDVDRAHIRRTLAQAQHRQSIIDAMNRPAEAVRQWHEYRPIFINQARIDGGIAFYRQNRVALDRIAAETGVPAEMIVAIIGVETSYGRVTGNHRVIDALYTLAFGFPRRAPFFAGELAQLFALEKAEPQLDILALKGSYAGAMGLGQFMPSSYRLWAKDGDGDGRRDLLTHLPDVFASIANYFVVHGWERGGPVVARASLEPGREPFQPDTLDPVHPLSQLAARGYRPLAGEPVAEGATVLNFQGASGPEHWIAYRNFYVISRYNRSPMYSLAVHQLAQSIRQGSGAG
ncbi:lytic murein transglycosylase B [Luteimonas aestuarii]|uniref:Lytic murein transglycosylase B n=1 Tax=Luteimonas aestuarii TaxID=453837 RepID=A0A4V3ALZ0_9GAMM|nr:lytic murein transglycosylase B [Luteimonas aestuarii]TDK24427.1 lytic murein transglycosylase B [Luteimonas aestuarii]